MKNLFIILLFLSHYHPTAFSQGFNEISVSAGIDHLHINQMLMGGGAAFFDYDNDGYLDLYLTGGETRDKLYHNNGNGTFTDVSLQAGLAVTDSINTMGVVTGDIDNDGYREVFLTTWDGYHNLLLKNNGNGTFQDISISAGISDTALSTSASFGDFNLDGYLDIYVVNYVDIANSNPINGFDYICYPNYLYLNNGNETFAESASAYGVADTGCGLATAITNFDQDGDMDVYIANDFGAWVLPNRLYKNNYPSANFSDITLISGMNDSIFGMGIAIGDYDEDGDFDYYVTNLGRNMLRNNQGNGTFADLTDSAGVANTYTDSNLFAVGWGTAFLDYDNDTYLDLFVANGHIPADTFIANSTSNPDVLFNNNGNGTFTDVSVSEGVNDTTMGRGFAYGDYDNDGDLDLLVMVVSDDSASTNHVLLYENNLSNGFHWLKIKVQGTTNNRDGFGTRVRVVSGGRSWIREIDGGSSHLSQSASMAHFGLGTYTAVDSVIVTWLGGGQQVVTNVNVDQNLSFIEDSTFFIFTNEKDSICPGDSVFVGGAYQTTPGFYTDTFVTSNGYDSLFITELITPAFITNVQVNICNGDSVFVGGAYQTTAGFYQDTLTSGNGCDSIVTTSLNIFPSTTVIDTSICEGTLYNGNVYTSDSTFSDTLTASNGCDSVLTTNITILFPYATVIDTSICEGTLYNGNVYTSDSTFSDTVAAANGCDSVLTTNITILFPSATVIDTSICEGTLYNGNVYTSDSTFSDTLTASNGCDSVSTTNITILFPSATVIDTSICEGAIYNGNVYTSDSTFSDILSASNGCDSVSTTNITILFPYATVIDTSICEGALYNGNVYISDSTFLDTLATANGCDSVLTTNITVLFPSTTVIDTSICEGTLYNGTVYTSDSTFSDTVMAVNGCDSVSTTNITILFPSSATIDTSINEGELYNGIIFNNDTTLMDTLIAVNGCDSVVTINISILSSSTAYTLKNTREPLLQIVPNPFNSFTSIRYYLPQTMYVEVRVYSLRGEEVALLLNRIQLAGDYSLIWQGTNNAGETLSAGIYICRLKAAENILHHKIILMNKEISH